MPAMKASTINLHSQIVKLTDEPDPVTNDMVIAILHEEELHGGLLEGSLREYDEPQPRS